MGTTTNRDYYTVAEAARRLNVSHSTVWRWIRARKLPAYRVGSRNLRIRSVDLDRLEMFEPDDRNWERLSQTRRRERLLRPLSDQEAREQKGLYERVMENRKKRLIAPLTSDELVRLGRDKDFWYGSDL
jgi:excisionase family DNA binding protein